MVRVKNWFKKVFHHGDGRTNSHNTNLISDDMFRSDKLISERRKKRVDYRARSRDDIYRVKDDKSKVKNFRKPLVVDRISFRTDSLSSNSREEAPSPIPGEDPIQPTVRSLQDFEDWLIGGMSEGPQQTLPSWTDAAVSFTSWSEEDQVVVSGKLSRLDSLVEILDEIIEDEPKGDRILASFFEDEELEGECGQPSIYEARTGTDSLEKFLEESSGSGSKEMLPVAHVCPSLRDCNNKNTEVPIMESKESDSAYQELVHPSKDSLIADIIRMLDKGVKPPGYNTYVGKKKKKHKYTTGKSVQSFDEHVSTIGAKTAFSEPTRTQNPTQNPTWFTMDGPASPPPPPPPSRLKHSSLNRPGSEEFHQTETTVQIEKTPQRTGSESRCPIQEVQRSPRDLSEKKKEAYADASGEMPIQPAVSPRRKPENMHPIARLRYKHDHDEYSPYYY